MIVLPIGCFVARSFAKDDPLCSFARVMDFVVYRKNGDDIYRFCYFLTQSKDLADDLYQDCFLAALEKEITVDEKKIKNFLMGIAANQWKNQWRKNKRRQKIMVQTEYNEQ